MNAVTADPAAFPPAALTVLDVIRARRTVDIGLLRPDAVPREVTEAILEAGIWAPNHGRTEPWRFTVFTGEGRARLADVFAQAYAAGTAPDRESEAALEAQFFTRADVAWLERDGQVRRLLMDGVKASGALWRAALGMLGGVGLLTWLICGWPGIPALIGSRSFTWAVPALLLLELVLLESVRRLILRQPARSAAVLHRMYGTLIAPPGIALNLLVFVPDVVTEPALLTAALGGALLAAYLTRPREALTLAGKAWRGAQ